MENTPKGSKARYGPTGFKGFMMIWLFFTILLFVAYNWR
jgi:hypothetical protein